ncbi:zinc finger matrin-type protein 5 [Rhodnius prolixus]|uniref:C3H1-type domain-containing protein n=2 Tax=Rhodnius TaxID=13248 RepID=T1IGG7_RHOPR
MGRRYYCEYCDRGFTDVVDSRKKHLNGISHQRLKKIYYCKVRDLKTLVAEERQKDSCRRFRNTGSCPFEEACTFTHYTNQELSAFEAQVIEEERKKNELPTLPPVKEWLNLRNHEATERAEGSVSVYGSNNPLKNYGFHSLPPSLRPISFEEMDNLQFLDWG